jgi:excisionase family DNA binding protein
MATSCSARMASCSTYPPPCSRFSSASLRSSRGDALTLVPVGKELTTQQCANILNVSRQYVVQLLDAGHIPYRRTGTHKRVCMEELLAYKRQRDRTRNDSLDDLTRLTQEFGRLR